MNTIELFSGTKSFSKVANRLGHNILTVDNDPTLTPYLELDLSSKSNWSQIVMNDFDIVWASPPCTSFSIASCSTHWFCNSFAQTKYYQTKSKEAELGLSLLSNTIEAISIMKPKFWFIENPRGLMRKIIDEIFIKYGIKDYKRVTVTYCQYGDSRMKPTDIWTNCGSWIPRPMCKNGDKCHESAPRGSRTGTQGLKNAKDRGVIPEALFEEIFNSL